MKNTTKNLWCLLATLFLFAIWTAAQNPKIVVYTDGAAYTQSMTNSPGAIQMRTNACMEGWTELTDWAGKMPVGTTVVAGDAGTFGGSDTITPTVATLTAAAQIFSGNSVVSSSVSGGTPAGTNGTAAFTPAGTNGTVTGPAQIISWPAGVPTLSGTTINAFSSVINHTHTITVTSLVQGGTTAATTGTHLMTSTATGGSARAPTAGDSFTATSANPGGGVASITPTINAPGTIAWPAGVPTNATSTIPAETFSGTPGTVPAEVFSGSALAGHTHTTTATGTNGTSAVTGTLNQFDNRSAYVRVIYCQKT